MLGHPSSDPPRRGFFKQLAVASAALPVGVSLVAPGTASAASASPAAAAQVAAPDAVLGYQSFSATEAAFVEALVNVMCPADRFTPNGVDCGLALFIDRQLAGGFGQGARRDLRGPFAAAKPQFGLQLPLTPEQHFKAGVAAVNALLASRQQQPLDQLNPAEIDRLLHEITSTPRVVDEIDLQVWFNELVYPLFTQACFSDPLYGGNAGKVFWKLLGYPGLPATNALNVVQFRNKPFPGSQTPMSIVDFS